MYKHLPVSLYIAFVLDDVNLYWNLVFRTLFFFFPDISGKEV